MKVLPFVSVLLYILAILCDILFEMMKNDVLKQFYWGCSILGSMIGMYYVIASLKKREQAKDEKEETTEER
jgi:lipid-A-disaccharide synthase-like uncharacterized protein